MTLNKYKAVTLFFAVLAALLIPVVVTATDHNIIPCFPEIVIAKSSSSYFRVADCQAKATINNDIANTSLKVVLLNQTDKEVSTSVKFRVLYATSKDKVSISVNGKAQKYDPENPNYGFSLNAGESINLELRANVYINYSIDAVRKAIKRMEKEENSSTVRDKRSRIKDNGQQLAESFMSLFKSNDRYGKRFKIGHLVSKWSIFPVDFDKLSLEIVVPDNYTVITDHESLWTRTEGSRKTLVFKTNNVDDYRDATFLPASDKEEHLATLKILESEKFKY